MPNSASPLIIEVAVSQAKARDEQTNSLYGPSLASARESLDAGASIIHFHQDLHLTQQEQIDQIVRMHKDILSTHPHAIMYSAPLLNEDTLWEINAHYPVLAEAGCLSMISMEMGLTMVPTLNPEGLPNGEWVNGHRFSECDDVLAFARKHRAPLSLGIYNPAMCYWIREYAQRSLIPTGSMIKIWMGGRYQNWSNRKPGVAFALKQTIKALDAYLEALEGVDLPWTVAGLGDNILDSPVARYALEKGGHIRVGQEDVAGTSDLSNSELVQAVIELAYSAGREVVSGAAAKAFLGLDREPAMQTA